METKCMINEHLELKKLQVRYYVIINIHVNQIITYHRRINYQSAYIMAVIKTKQLLYDKAPCVRGRMELKLL